jgi:protein-disulfide isomerase
LFFVWQRFSGLFRIKKFFWHSICNFATYCPAKDGVMLPQTKLSQPVIKLDHILGSANASLTLVEYGDYECPYCGDAHAVVQKILKALSGDIRFVFRNFPLTQAHPYALDAAKAAEAAGLQDSFWKMHDLLFENQDYLDQESLVSYAMDLNLDLDKFIGSMNSEEVEDRILSELYEGTRTGVDGTPTFFVNEYRFEGDWRTPEFVQTLDALSRKPASRIHTNELHGTMT